MSRTPNSRKQETHERILDVAARAIRRHGYAGVGVADVMKAAGLTHGGFYGHFDSKDDLVAQAIAHIFTVQEAGQGGQGLAAYLDAYLSPWHRDRVGEGCPTAALVADIRPRTADRRERAHARA